MDKTGCAMWTADVTRPSQTLHHIVVTTRVQCRREVKSLRKELIAEGFSRLGCNRGPGGIVLTLATLSPFRFSLLTSCSNHTYESDPMTSEYRLNMCAQVAE